MEFPDHWCESARGTVEAVMEERPDLTAAEYASLCHAAELENTAEALEEEVRQSGDILVKGSMGQMVVNGAITEARLARSAAAKILHALAPKTANVGMSASKAGQHAASTRWNRARSGYAS